MGALAGEVALISGGGSGLGRAIVDRFIEEGARVVVLDHKPEKLAALTESHGEAVAILAGDVRSFADNEAAVALALSRFGKLDCAIGNAGIWDYSVALADLPGDALGPAFDELMGVNVKGYLLLAKAALPALVASRGSIVFTASNAAYAPGGGGPLYTASKHAVRGLIRQLAHELAPAIRVNGVAPGPIETDLRGPASMGLEGQAIDTIGLTAMASAAMPLALVPAARDYAGGYVFFASRRDNIAATGSLLELDCGIGIRGIGQPAGGAGLAKRFGATP